MLVTVLMLVTRSIPQLTWFLLKEHSLWGSSSESRVLLKIPTLAISEIADQSCCFNLFVWFGSRVDPIVNNLGMLTLDNKEH